MITCNHPPGVGAHITTSAFWSCILHPCNLVLHFRSPQTYIMQ